MMMILGDVLQFTGGLQFRVNLIDFARYVASLYKAHLTSQYDRFVCHYSEPHSCMSMPEHLLKPWQRL